MNSPNPVLVADTGASVWASLRVDAATAAAAEPILASFLNATVLHHDRFSDALAYHLAQKLANADMNALLIRDVCHSAFEDWPELITIVERDMRAVRERDPACRTYLQPFLYFKGLVALQAYRISHWLWREGRDILAFHLQSRTSELFAIDIHPAAEIGAGVFIDHGTGIVIGETSRVGDDVSMLHGVNLGGTGKERGDRHPKIGRGVLLGAHAKVLGNITVGDYAKIAAGSVVLSPVPAGCTVAGVPGRLINCPTCPEPAASMDQTLPAQAQASLPPQ